MLKMYSVFVFIIFFTLGVIDSSFAKQEIYEKESLGKIAEDKRASGEIIVKFKEGVSEKVPIIPKEPQALPFILPSCQLKY